MTAKQINELLCDAPEECMQRIETASVHAVAIADHLGHDANMLLEVRAAIASIFWAEGPFHSVDGNALAIANETVALLKGEPASERVSRAHEAVRELIQPIEEIDFT
jgi:hypothetical protein